MVDALGNLVRFLLLPGQRHESKGVASRISNLPFDALLADKAFDRDDLLRELPVRSATAGHPAQGEPPSTALLRQGSRQAAPSDREFLCQNQGDRYIVTGYDQAASSYAAHWNLVATLLAAR